MAFKGRRPNFGEDLVEQFKDSIELSTAEALAAVDADLKDSSPVDSGRFRASWFLVQSRGGIPDTNEVAPEPAKGKKVKAPPTINADELDGGANSTIISNLDYAQRLCEQGWSKKVPEDWFTRIKQRWVAGGYLDEAFRRNVKLS